MKLFVAIIWHPRVCFWATQTSIHIYVAVLYWLIYLISFPGPLGSRTSSGRGSNTRGRAHTDSLHRWCAACTRWKRPDSGNATWDTRIGGDVECSDWRPTAFHGVSPSGAAPSAAMWNPRKLWVIEKDRPRLIIDCICGMSSNSWNFSSECLVFSTVVYHAGIRLKHDWKIFELTSSGGIYKLSHWVTGRVYYVSGLLSSS